MVNEILCAQNEFGIMVTIWVRTAISYYKYIIIIYDCSNHMYFSAFHATVS